MLSLPAREALASLTQAAQEIVPLCFSDPTHQRYSGMNFLLIQALATSARYYGDSFSVECPTGSGRVLTLARVANELATRLTRVFVRDTDGRRAVFGENDLCQNDPQWRDYVPFHEYFHGDTGERLGAGHQTGWTALVALLIQHGGQLNFEKVPVEVASETQEGKVA